MDCVFSGHRTSLQRLRAASPDQLSFVIDGAKVDVPLLFPRGEALPLLYGNGYEPDPHELKKQFGTHMSHIHRAYINLDYDFEPPPSDTAIAFVQGDMPQNNTLSPKAPRRRFKKLLAEIDLPFGFRIDKVLQTSAAYCFRDKEIHFPGKAQQARRYGYHGSSAWFQELDCTRSVLGHTKGYYWLLGTETIGGVPLWGNYINDDSRNIYEFEDVHYAIPDGGTAWLRMQSERNFDLLLGGLVEPVAMVMDDTPLAPLDELLSVVAHGIDSGEIRSIDSIELGYSLALRLDHGKPLDPHITMPENPAYMIVPTWRVNGYTLKDGWKRLSSGLTEPTSWERHCTYDLDYELRFNAITMRPWNNPLALE